MMSIRHNRASGKGCQDETTPLSLSFPLHAVLIPQNNNPFGQLLYVRGLRPSLDHLPNGKFCRSNIGFQENSSDYLRHASRKTIICLSRALFAGSTHKDEPKPNNDFIERWKKSKQTEWEIQDERREGSWITKRSNIPCLAWITGKLYSVGQDLGSGVRPEGIWLIVL